MTVMRMMRKCGEQKNNTFFNEYSGTSINGPSQKRTTSQKWTVTKAPIETTIELNVLTTSEKRPTSVLQTTDRARVPACEFSCQVLRNGQ